MGFPEVYRKRLFLFSQAANVEVQTLNPGVNKRRQRFNRKTLSTGPPRKGTEFEGAIIALQLGPNPSKGCRV